MLLSGILRSLVKRLKISHKIYPENETHIFIKQCLTLRRHARFREEYSYVNWRGASGMRDKLIHGYFGVDLSIFWSTAKKDLPQFSKEIIEIREIIVQPEKKK